MDKKTKLLLEKGESLPIMEAFYTIQGEGFHKGSASYFIRTVVVTWVVIGAMLKKAGMKIVTQLFRLKK